MQRRGTERRKECVLNVCVYFLIADDYCRLIIGREVRQAKRSKERKERTWRSTAREVANILIYQHTR